MTVGPASRQVIPACWMQQTVARTAPPAPHIRRPQRPTLQGHQPPSRLARLLTYQLSVMVKEESGNGGPLLSKAPHFAVGSLLKYLVGSVMLVHVPVPKSTRARSVNLADM